MFRAFTCPSSGFLCGDLTFNVQRRGLTPLLKKCCELYFGYKVGDQDKNWAPHICCLICVKRLTDWAKGFSAHEFCYNHVVA